MLVSLVKNHQLKQKNKKSSSLLFLVTEYGVLLAPLDNSQLSVLAPEVYTGKAVATFDIPQKNSLTKEAIFDDLFVYIDKIFGKNAKSIYKVLFENPSLTIICVEQTLKIPREVAKGLIDELVKANAYHKYFSYWKRTKEFGEWLLTKLL